MNLSLSLRNSCVEKGRDFSSIALLDLTEGLVVIETAPCVVSHTDTHLLSLNYYPHPPHFPLRNFFDHIIVIAYTLPTTDICRTHL